MLVDDRSREQSDAKKCLAAFFENALNIWGLYDSMNKIFRQILHYNRRF